MRISVLSVPHRRADTQFVRFLKRLPGLERQKLQY